MTGVQNTQITCLSTITHNIVGPATAALQLIDVGNELRIAPMHVAMSNVYDQFRVRKVTLKITPASTVNSDPVYTTFFTVFDRNGFAAGVNVASLQTYSSYKQTAYSANATNKAPVHYVSWENNTLFEKSRYYPTKSKPQAGFIETGSSLPVAPNAAVTLTYNISWTFDITYRGLRADSSEIADAVGRPE